MGEGQDIRPFGGPVLLDNTEVGIAAREELRKHAGRYPSLLKAISLIEAEVLADFLAHSR